jgi:hypothetical protein
VPDLLIRPTGLDAALMTRFLTPLSTRTWADLVVRPRLVLDAVTAARLPKFAATARVAGVPLLVDPNTYYLQDQQHPTDPWAALPFARAGVMTVADLTRAVEREIVEAAIDFQIRRGATHLIAPYVHIKTANDGWVDKQIGLYRTTRAVLDERGIALPTVAVLDLSWRLLDQVAWTQVLIPVLTAIEAAGFDEIALAGSNVDGGVRPEDRVATLLASVRRAGRVAPVIAWNQGLLGELCVAVGAVGYSTGIGWREKWDASTYMRDRRTTREPGPRTPRPVYIDKLGRSIPKKSIQQLVDRRGIAPDLPCPPGRCCPTGASGLLEDSRWHTLYARVASLRQLTDTDPAFRWSHLRTRAEAGLDLARRINTVAAREDINRVDDTALRAIATCAHTAQKHRRTHAA